MKTVYPKYAEIFKCIASDCPDTCCALWEIVIDKKFQDIYKKSPSPAAKKAVDAMYTDSDGDVCLRLNGGRCPMLNEDNLCELYIHMGSDALCDVCRVYPRFNKEFEGMTFSGISLSCPESARLILSDTKSGELSCNLCPKDKVSAFIFEVYRFLEFKAKNADFNNLYDICEAIQDEMDFGDFEAAKRAMTAKPCATVVQAEELIKFAKTICSNEFLTDEWNRLRQELLLHLTRACQSRDYRKKRDAAFQSASQIKEMTNIRVYYLYKYLAESIDEGDILTLYDRCRTCSMIICELYAMEIINHGSISFERKLRLAQLFSKEIEHNEDSSVQVNLGKIMDH